MVAEVQPVEQVRPALGHPDGREVVTEGDGERVEGIEVVDRRGQPLPTGRCGRPGPSASESATQPRCTYVASASSPTRSTTVGSVAQLCAARRRRCRR